MSRFRDIEAQKELKLPPDKVQRRLDRRSLEI